MKTQNFDLKTQKLAAMTLQEMTTTAGGEARPRPNASLIDYLNQSNTLSFR